MKHIVDDDVVELGEEEDTQILGTSKKTTLGTKKQHLKNSKVATSPPPQKKKSF